MHAHAYCYGQPIKASSVTNLGEMQIDLLCPSVNKEDRHHQKPMVFDGHRQTLIA